ncbi:Uncharacterised protein [uncultured archaeon]|nr:Uncharacterised protein [uncultured archaeon]
MGSTPGFGGIKMVTDEFNAMCTLAQVEARVQPMPNPGDPMNSCRLITFTNFSNKDMATVIEQGRKTFGKEHIIGPAFTLQIMIGSGDPLPIVLKGSPNENAGIPNSVSGAR